MPERRQLPRSRVYYGGLLSYGVRSSTFACIVRNFSPSGAKIELDGAEMLPDEVDFEIERKHLSCRGRLIWRKRGAAGLRFYSPGESGDVIPLGWVRKLRDTERLNSQLKSRLEQLLHER